VPRLFELLTALLEYLDLLQGDCSPPPSGLLHLYDCDYYNDWNIQYSGTALLLLVNPCILHRNNRTTQPISYLITSKPGRRRIPLRFLWWCSEEPLTKFCYLWCFWWFVYHILWSAERQTCMKHRLCIYLPVTGRKLLQSQGSVLYRKLSVLTDDMNHALFGS